MEVVLAGDNSYVRVISKTKCSVRVKELKLLCGVLEAWKQRVALV